MRLWNETFFSRKLVMKYVLFLVVAAFLMKFTKSTAFVLAIPIAAWSVMQRKTMLTFFVVLLAITSIITNGWFVPKPMVYAVVQRGLMVGLGFMTCFQIFGQRQSPYLKPMLGLFPYLIYEFFVSFEGYAPLISMLKLFLFSATFITFYVAVTSVVNARSVDVRKLRSMILAISVFFILGSVAMRPFPAISFMNAAELKNAVEVVSLFKGMTTHSQELGPVVSALGLFLLGDYLFSIQKKNGLYAIMLSIVPVLVYMTSSRTAMGGMLSGVAYLGFCVFISRGMKNSWKNSVLSAFYLFMVLAFVGVVSLPSVRTKIAKFVVKYDDRGKVESAEQVFASRQHKWDEALAGWRHSPYFGNGFQVSANMHWFQANSFKDVLSAPIEKSTWIFAVLEEGGVVGMIIFCMFLVYAFVVLLSRRAYVGSAMFFNLMVMNLGEFTVFSMSGGGGFMWALVFAGLGMDAIRNREREATSYPMGFGPPSMMMRGGSPLPPPYPMPSPGRWR